MNKLLTILTLMFVLAATAVTAVTEYVPVYVTGIVYDGQGNTIEGASVEVTCVGFPQGTPQYVLTDSEGEYTTVFFADNPCYISDTVTAKATYNDMTGEAQGVLCAYPEQCPIPVFIADITIPELTMLGAMVVVLAGVGIIAYRRKN